MKISNIIMGVAFSCLTISCDDFIEVAPSGVLNDEIAYSSPEEIATFIKRTYDYVEHIEYKKAHFDLGWRPIIKGSLECICTYGLWHDISP